MPRARAFRSALLARLWDELRFAPAATLVRIMADAEAFAAQLDPLAGYPEDLVVHRLTRYRPDGTGNGEVVVGEALIEDIGAFIERASLRVPQPADARGGALRLPDAAKALGVSRATLQRYRAMGLLCHHVDAPGTPLSVYREALDAFAARHGARVSRAARTGRVQPGERERLRRDALARLQRGPATVQQLSQALAAECGRCHRTVRRVLEGDPRVLAVAARTSTPTLDRRQAAVAARAWHLGIGPQAMAEGTGASVASCTRALQRGRAAQVRQALALAHPLELPTFARADSDQTLLAPPAVRTGLPAGPWLLPRPRLAPAEGAPRPQDLSRVVAQHFLLWRARAALPTGARPTPDILDAVERDLRWAYRLRRALVEGALPDALARVAQHLGVPWARLPDELKWAWARAVAREAGQALDFASLHAVALDTVHPMRAMSLAVERLLSRQSPERIVAATYGHLAADTAAPWMAHLGSGDRWVPYLAALPAADAVVLARRLGLDGSPPATLAELALHLGASPSTVQARVYAAMQQARRMARAG